MEDSARLDIFVAKQLPDLPRTHARRLIDTEQVLVNGQPVTKAGYRLRATDEVQILQSHISQDIPKISIPILYEDEDCVVINKPVGLLSHSKGAFNPEPTVASWLANMYTDKSEGDRDGIVHRLDRGTSGVMICAKNITAQKFLQKQFSVRKVKKTYIALIEDTMDPPQAVIDMPIQRNPKEPQRFRVGANGKPSVTAYKTLKTIKHKDHAFSTIELKPTTGRTHQLRVHLGYFKHPIVGDSFYKGLEADRLYLHAQSLEITLPNKQRKTFIAELPAEFEEPKV